MLMIAVVLLHILTVKLKKVLPTNLQVILEKNMVLKDGIVFKIHRHATAAND